jgi:hypothetical protein
MPASEIQKQLGAGHLSQTEWLGALERTLAKAEKTYDEMAVRLEKAEKREDGAAIRKALSLPTNTVVISPELADRTVIVLAADDASIARLLQTHGGEIIASNDPRVSTAQQSLPFISADGKVTSEYSLTKSGGASGDNAFDPVSDLLDEARALMNSGQGWGASEVSGKQSAERVLE